MAGQGDKSIISSIAANVILTVIKFLAFFFGGGAGMFSEAIHSTGDATNSILLYFGKRLSRRPACKRHPFGYGKRINLACVIAGMGLIVGAYFAISHGIGQMKDPHPGQSLNLQRIVLILAFLFDGSVLLTVMKEIKREAKIKGNLFIVAIKNFQKASSTTRFIFFEDLVATLGVIIALVGLETSHLTGNYFYDGLSGLLIGIMIVGIAIKLIWENKLALLEVAACDETHRNIGNIVRDLPEVTDIHDIDVITHGDYLKVYLEVEANPELRLKDADDIIFAAEAAIKNIYPNVIFVSVEVMADDGKQDWDY